MVYLLAASASTGAWELRHFTTRENATDISPFIITTSPEAVRKEKDKARVLRKTQWWQRQIAKGVCRYCQKPTPPKELTMDHIVPLIRGGTSTRGNVAPACKECNTKKKHLLPLEWDEYLRSIQQGSAPAPGGAAADSTSEV